MAQNVGPGEQRFNAAIYKSSHNSYQRNESLAEQIDDYNIWLIELDIIDYEDQLKVRHDCGDLWALHEAQTLSDILTKLVAESKTYTYKFTIIYLDMKDCRDWGSQLNDRLRAALTNSLGESHIYSSQEFINTDQRQWPSFQNLTRRGFYWGVVVDWHTNTPDNAMIDSIMFQAISTNPSKAVTMYDNAVLVCTSGGCDSGVTQTPPDDPRDERWLYRVYPGDACLSSCDLHIGSYWTSAIESSYNFIATNCVNRAATFVPSVHSPSPLFVDQSAIVACPLDDETCEWGTYSFPYHDLKDAIDRASPMVSLFIKAGEYPLRNDSPQFIIGKPLILKAIDGVVRIK